MFLLDSRENSYLCLNKKLICEVIISTINNNLTKLARSTKQTKNVSCKSGPKNSRRTIACAKFPLGYNTWNFTPETVC